MSRADFVALLPLIILAVSGIVVMLVGAFGGGRRALHIVTISGLGTAILSIGVARDVVPRSVTVLLRVDGFALFFWTILYASVGLVALLASPYLATRRRNPEAFYTLLLFAAVGMGVLACSDHFAALFLGLEILTVALYTLIGYLRDTRRSLEAAAKYLVLAALASGLLLFGIALVYASSGTLSLGPAFRAVLESLPRLGQQPEAAWALAGSLLLLAGFGFKLALVPFHMWSPDVYQGAPAPTTALIAAGSKGAVLAVLLRALASVGFDSAAWAPALGVLAVATMFGGNLLALLQTDLKRLLAYSSVAHLGYVLVAVAAGGAAGAEAVAFYVLTYVLTTVGAFGVITVLSSETMTEADSLALYRGLGRSRPGLAAALALMMLSLAGVPATGGFLAKFAVLNAAIGAGATWLAVALVMASGIALFYYLRVIVVMYMQETEEPAPTRVRVPVGSVAVLLGVSALIVGIGVYPDPWFRAVSSAIATILS